MRRKHSLVITHFNQTATLASEAFGANRSRVVAISKRIGPGRWQRPDRRTARGVDREARELAAYLVVTCYDFTRSEVARALNLDVSTARYWCAKVERRRDNSEYNNLVSSIEQRLPEAPCLAQ